MKPHFTALAFLGGSLLLACNIVTLPAPAPASTPTSTIVPTSASLIELDVAAGKPTTASGYWQASENHAYPPANIVDRRVDERDGCTEGPTTYWLLPDHQLGWVQIDLQQNFPVVRLRWLNTHNGRCGHDRATLDFHIALSSVGTFTGEEQVVVTRRMTYALTPAYEEIALPEPVTARYIRFYVDAYYHWGGGLNELEVHARLRLP